MVRLKYKAIAGQFDGKMKVVGLEKMKIKIEANRE